MNSLVLFSDTDCYENLDTYVLSSRSKSFTSICLLVVVRSSSIMLTILMLLIIFTRTVVLPVMIGCMNDLRYISTERTTVYINHRLHYFHHWRYQKKFDTRHGSSTFLPFVDSHSFKNSYQRTLLVENILSSIRFDSQSNFFLDPIQPDSFDPIETPLRYLSSLLSLVVKDHIFGR